MGRKRQLPWTLKGSPPALNPQSTTVLSRKSKSRAQLRESRSQGRNKVSSGLWRLASCPHEAALPGRVSHKASKISDYLLTDRTTNFYIMSVVAGRVQLVQAGSAAKHARRSVAQSSTSYLYNCGKARIRCLKVTDWRGLKWEAGAHLAEGAASSTATQTRTPIKKGSRIADMDTRFPYLCGSRARVHLAEGGLQLGDTDEDAQRRGTAPIHHLLCLLRRVGCVFENAFWMESGAHGQGFDGNEQRCRHCPTILASFATCAALTELHFRFQKDQRLTELSVRK